MCDAERVLWLLRKIPSATSELGALGLDGGITARYGAAYKMTSRAPTVIAEARNRQCDKGITPECTGAATTRQQQHQHHQRQRQRDSASAKIPSLQGCPTTSCQSMSHPAPTPTLPCLLATHLETNPSGVPDDINTINLRRQRWPALAPSCRTVP